MCFTIRHEFARWPNFSTDGQLVCEPLLFYSVQCLFLIQFRREGFISLRKDSSSTQCVGGFPPACERHGQYPERTWCDAPSPRLAHPEPAIDSRTRPKTRRGVHSCAQRLSPAWSMAVGELSHLRQATTKATTGHSRFRQTQRRLKST